MKVLQIEAPGRAAWREAPVSEPRTGEIVIRVGAVATCPHWDLHLMAGEPMFEGMDLRYPYTPGQPGHEVVGEVVAQGPGVSTPALGARVAAWRDPGGRRQGCYAQYAVLEAEHVLAVPPNLSDEQVASLELAMCVQVSFDQLLQLDAVREKRLAVAGLGPAGLIAVQMAQAYGAREVLGIDPLPDRRALAARLGATAVCAPGAAALPTARTAVEAFDAALDTTGLKPSIEALMHATRRAVAIFGVLRETVAFGPAQWYGGFSLLGYGEHNRGAAERAFALIEQGRLDLVPLLTHHLPFERYEEGVALLRRKEAIKVLFLPWNGVQEKAG